MKYVAGCRCGDCASCRHRIRMNDIGRSKRAKEAHRFEYQADYRQRQAAARSLDADIARLEGRPFRPHILPHEQRRAEYLREVHREEP